MANIVVGVTGGIAAYKAADVVSVLANQTRLSAESRALKTELILSNQVKVVMTEKAKQFITPLTLATLSKNPVLDDAAEWVSDGVIKHIDLAKWLDVLVVVPATANTLVKFAQGIADNLLTSLFLALSKNKRVVLVPAMNTMMWDNPNFQRSLAELKILEADRRAKITVVPPVEGMLACGDIGMGKIAPTKTIVEAVEYALKEGI